MLLKKIKLSGFKSFVDPTAILMPSNLIAVVGPNGCGKSNIIDAVCWVMGESSAKNLRGESLADVIFNGSTQRKPIGQASVELVFDNQDCSLAGEYASYAEISIKRVLSRDGDSQYYLNGTRCRRKDIVDIFLGTGLGPRSYSIIGQNMISRIIEAKPDDMRVYLEEAAGISKYKERRRETENRIQHTQDNLARLNDVRAELDKQLQHLKRQANAAEKFKILKEDERKIRSEWYGIQWKNLNDALAQHLLQVQQQETQLEGKHTELSNTDKIVDQRREELENHNKIFQDIQKQFYTVGNEINRIEQEIRHHQEKKQQWQNDLTQVSHDWNQTHDLLLEMQDQSKELNTDVAKLKPESIKANDTVLEAAIALKKTEESMQHLQNAWDDYHQQNARLAQTAQVEQTKIQHLEQKISNILSREKKLQEDQNKIDFRPIEDEVKIFADQLTQDSDKGVLFDLELKNIREEINHQQTLNLNTQKELDLIKNKLGTLKGQKASLETLQQTALGQRNNQMIQWLTKHSLEKNPRLAQHISVEKGWEHAVEKVLGSSLQSICVGNLQEVKLIAQELKEGNLSIFVTDPASENQSYAPTSLLSKIHSKWTLDSFLANVYVADSLDEAINISKTLKHYESVITKDGIWLNASWAKIIREKNAADGIFIRENELKMLDQQIETLTQEQTALEDKLILIREKLKELEKKREATQQDINQHYARITEIQAQYKIKNEKLSELKRNSERICLEINDCQKQQQEAQQELEKVRNSWQKTMMELESFSKQRETLQQQKETQKEQLVICRDKLNQAKDIAHQLEIRLQTSQSQLAALQQTITRLESQQKTLLERKLHLESELTAQGSSETMQQQLNDLLNKRLTIEDELQNAQHILDQTHQALKVLENERHDTEREISKYRDHLEKIRVEAQGLKIKAQNIAEQIQELGFSLENVLQLLPENINPDEWQMNLEQITQRISRLGPINLVAIEEYATCSDRKTYLDKQHDDLQEGLATLASAIEKIDKETRARFKETYEFVNQRFQELFPKIFGGGKAYLELTEENLLDAGVAVMACPPGKRNSTIHLLSGGEKAMTAIALVFSIFHLNPAPFCLLDEVDAPLDDANIGRFCHLVQEMSAKTQFIFISHNKLAIEMAQHLIGVTMHEPGVSRLVSVNVEEAVSLAGA